MPPGSHSNPVPRMEKKMPQTKQMTNHFSLVLKLRDEASRTLGRKGKQNMSFGCLVQPDSSE